MYCILIDAHLSDGDQLALLYNVPHCEQYQGGSEAKWHRKGTGTQFDRSRTQLISQVILGVDFLQQQGLVLDFTTSPVSVTVARQKRPTPVSTAPGPAPLPEPEALQAIRKGERERGERRCASWHPWKIQLQMVIPIFNEFADAEFPGICQALL